MLQRLRFCLCALLAGLAVSGAALAITPPEYEVKLAFLYNFTQYIQWPTEAGGNGHFNFCVLGQNPFGEALDTLKEKQARNLPIAVHFLADPKGGSNCHLIFIAASEQRRLASLLQTLDRPGLLTVTDLPDGIQNGAVITLKLVAGKVRFAINPARAKAAGLTVSAQLLKLAEIVE